MFKSTTVMIAACAAVLASACASQTSTSSEAKAERSLNGAALACSFTRPLYEINAETVCGGEPPAENIQERLACNEAIRAAQAQAQGFEELERADALHDKILGENGGVWPIDGSTSLPIEHPSPAISNMTFYVSWRLGEPRTSFPDTMTLTLFYDGERAPTEVTPLTPAQHIDPGQDLASTDDDVARNFVSIKAAVDGNVDESVISVVPGNWSASAGDLDWYYNSKNLEQHGVFFFIDDERENLVAAECKAQ